MIGKGWATRDVVAAPTRPDLTPDASWQALEHLLGGLIRVRDGAIRLGPVPLLRLGPPAAVDGGWSWAIEGSLLARRPGGKVTIGWRDGQLVQRVEGYHPSLPGALYRATQLPFHHLVTRLSLLRVRGPLPAPGMPATPVARAAATAADLVLMLAAARAMGRRRVLARAVLLGAAYHVAAWSLDGSTLGQRLVGTRLLAVDGSRVTPGQAAVRLLLMPVAVLRMRAIHDEVAGTDEVATR